MNITAVLAVRNNLGYTKEFYNHFRELYPEVPLVISSGGSMDGTGEWLEETWEQDTYFGYRHTSEDICFSENYNIAISLVKTEKIVLVHNDMILGEGFLEELDRHLDENSLISYTTVEPPIFPDHERPGKMIRDFGRDFTSFNKVGFSGFVERSIGTPLILTDNVSFFMAGYKSTFDQVGGFDDKVFKPYFCEDDDIILRFKLAGKGLKTTNKALCYHFVSKTSRFSEEFKEKTRKIEENSNKNFIRKWGFRSSSYNVSRNLVIQLSSATYNLVQALEPWCSYLFINDMPLREEYLEKEQNNTTFDLSSRVGNTIPHRDIILEIDGRQFTQEDYQAVQNIQDVLEEFGEVGEFEIGNMKLVITKYK